MIKDYSSLTSRIYTQLEPELAQEFHSMLTDMAQEISRLYEIENAKPSIALECLENIKNFEGSYGTLYDSYCEELVTIKQALLKAQEQEQKLDRVEKLTQLIFKERRKMGEEYIKWCEKNNAKYDDATTMITWVLCFKLKEVLNNE